MSNICKECCAELPEGVAACPECGAPVPAPASPAAPAAARPEPSPFPSAVPAPRNAGGSAKKVFASQVSETNSTDNSSHVQDNSSNVTTTIINQGRVEQEYCDVCGNALEKGHAKCPKCGKKICPSCKAKGKNRCTDCDRRAKDEYRLEFRGTLLEMDGKLNAFGRRHMDELARKLDISPAEKEEIEKEFAPSAASGAGTRIGGVKAASAPVVVSAPEIVSAFPGVRVPSAAEKPAAAPASKTASQKGLGSLRGGASSAYVPQGVAVPPRNPSPPPASSGNAASSGNSGAGTKTDDKKQKNEIKLESLKWRTAILGFIGVLLLVGYRVYCVCTGDTFVPKAISGITERAPLPETFRSLRNYAEFEQQKGLDAWAKTKTPELFEQLPRLEAQASAVDEKMVQIANADRENYQASPEFRDEKIRLSELERSAKAIRDEIADAHARWAERDSVPATFRRTECTDYTRFDDEKIAKHVRRKNAADFAALSDLEKSARELDGKLLALAKKIESDPATWGTYRKNEEFASMKAELEKLEAKAIPLHARLNVPPPATKPYALARGDTPTKICEKHGITMEELRALNPGVEFSVLKMKVGQVISVPATEED